LLCIKATDFCKLILYPATLLKLFMVFRSFGVEFFGSLRYWIMSSANRDTLTVSLPIYIPFIPSSCLIALVRNPRTVLNRSGESGHPGLIPDFSCHSFLCKNNGNAKVLIHSLHPLLLVFLWSRTLTEMTICKQIQNVCELNC
jgi:hypothetical protein